MAGRERHGHLKADKAPPYAGVVMRCQCKTPTPGHAHLLMSAAKNHDTIVVVLGYTGGMPTEKDPLTTDMRAAMLREKFPHLNLVFRFIMDNPQSQRHWSKDLDAIIRDTVPPHRGIVLYDGRKGFSRRYTGRHKVVRVRTLRTPSGTHSRNSSAFPHSEDGREAQIAFQTKRPGFGYSTVDNVIYDPATDEFILIGKAEFGRKLAFAGGHWDKTKRSDRTMEGASDREGGEEIKGIRTSRSRQLYTMPVADPRYRESKKDGNVTTLCVSRYISGTPKAADDAKFVERVKRKDLLKRLIRHHVPLGRYVLNNWDRVKELLDV